MRRVSRVLINFATVSTLPVGRHSRAVLAAATEAKGFRVLTSLPVLKQWSSGGDDHPPGMLHHKVWNGPEYSEATKCWYCEKDTHKWKHLICDDCGLLQEVNANLNYYEIFDFPQTFGLPLKELTTRFRDLQSIVHPDRFLSKSLQEQLNAEHWSSLINKAYKTLYAPIERGQYLLRLEGMEIPQDNSALDKNFLMEMMERNEELEKATTKKDLEQLNKRVAKDLEVKVAELKALFDAKDLEAASAALVRMKYLASIQNSIKEKLMKKLGG